MLGAASAESIAASSTVGAANCAGTGGYEGVVTEEGPGIPLPSVGITPKCACGQLQSTKRSYELEGWIVGTVAAPFSLLG
jgi:hypothetical protein